MITTERLYIRNLQNEDYLEMLEYMSNPEVLQYEAFNPFDNESLKKFVSDFVPTKKFYVIILRKTNKIIGHLYLGLTTPPGFDEYNLGYIINPKHQNKGYCTEAAKAMIDYAFNVFRIHRITAKCNPDNIPSWKVMEKIGLKKEGLLKQRVTFKTDKDNNPIYWDELVYGIVNNKW